MVINVHNGENDSGHSSGSSGSSGGCGSGCSTGQCGNGLEKVYPTAVVRYGYMHAVGEFRYPNKDMKFGCGAQVIIQSNRGIELGEMVSVSCDGCDKCVSRDQIKSYVAASGPDYYNFSNGKILRLASPEDLSDWEHIRAESLRKKKFCQERADQANLPMKVIECEHLFGGERVVFYFMAEGRVDFRTLVRGLADEFQTRIEMRQVGARDEARLLADYETCGRECCCKTFLKTLRPISMKMAKMQKATLDPAKVSGRCGRLKCCLRYEHTTYEELNRKLPSVGRKVFTEHGSGTVVARQILTQLLQIQTADGGRMSVTVEDLIDEVEATRRAEERVRAAEEQRAQAAAAAAERRKPREKTSAGNEDKPRGQRSRRGRRRGQSQPRPGEGAPTGAAAPGADTPSAPQPAAEKPTDAAGQPDAPKRRRRRGRRSSRGRRGGDSGQPNTGDGGPSPTES